MKLSIIIPAFNASNTILRCLDSIYQLGLIESDFEVIIVDDCSRDATVKMAEDYAMNHTNMIVLQQPENHRQGAARNRGVSIAKGEYLAFVDSDDMIDKGVVLTLTMAFSLDLDMAVMGYKRILLNERNVEEKAKLNVEDGQLFTGIEMQTKQPFWATAPWAYLYKLSFLKAVNYPFAEDVMYEDTDFVNVHLYHAKRMASCQECGYQFCENATSTTHCITSNHIADYFLLGTRMLEFYKSIEDKSSKYGCTILEGGSFNIRMAFKRLYKLQSSNDIKAAFARIDNHYDRKVLLSYREPAYCWNMWTRTCLKYKNISIILSNLARNAKKIGC